MLKMLRPAFAGTLVVCFALSPAVAWRAFAQIRLKGDPVAGNMLYQACMGCHSLDENDIGPKHRGIVGRKAGIIPGYAYSAALKSSSIIWTPEKLNVWLANPQKLVPGAKMFFSVSSPKQRTDIIAYLATQK